MAHLCLTSPLGPLTLFDDDGGHIVAVEFGRAPGGGGSALLDVAARQLQYYFDGSLKHFELPLRPHGTPFQLRVWTLIGRIPHGRTRSYGELAGDLGSSARAVGGACGANPIPIIIPCHRVLAAHRRIGGYSGAGGADGKRALLRREGAAI